MTGYRVEFNVYAGSQDEADAASRAIKDFISARAREGVAVTAAALARAVSRWGDSVIVRNYFKR